MNVESPGGFVFGIQGYTYGQKVPTSITFFVDGTTRVCDHRGNAMPEYEGSHAEVIAKLVDARVPWQQLSLAGWPQLPYDQLKELEVVPPTPIDDLAKIKDKALRADAIKLRREVDAIKAEEEAEEAVV